MEKKQIIKFYITLIKSIISISIVFLLFHLFSLILTTKSKVLLEFCNSYEIEEFILWKDDAFIIFLFFTTKHVRKLFFKFFDLTNLTSCNKNNGSGLLLPIGPSKLIDLMKSLFIPLKEILES